VALTAVMLCAARMFPAGDTRPPARAGWLLILSYVGVLSHVGLDLLNNYGVRLLAPFDWRWFYGDTSYIIDPWLWLTLGTGIWIARRRTTPTPARGAVIVATLYVAAMWCSAWLARGIVIERWRSTHAVEPQALMVGPLPITPFQRQVIVDAGRHYETGTFEWLPSRVTFDPTVVPKNDDDPRVRRARDAPNIRAFLVWSRFPFWTIEATPDGARVSVSDMRFAGRGSLFVQSVVVR
jgi:inner membrane protein